MFPGRTHTGFIHEDEDGCLGGQMLRMKRCGDINYLQWTTTSTCNSIKGSKQKVQINILLDFSKRVSILKARK